MKRVFEPRIAFNFSFRTVSEEEFLPFEIILVVKFLPIIDSILVCSMTDDVVRITVVDSFRDVQYGKHIILKAEPTNIFQMSLPR